MKMSSFRSALFVFAMCVLAVANGFAPIARRSLPVTIHNFKQVRSSSQGSYSSNFRLFADNDGNKITRDKEGEFFESNVSSCSPHSLRIIFKYSHNQLLYNTPLPVWQTAHRRSSPNCFRFPRFCFIAFHCRTNLPLH